VYKRQNITISQNKNVDLNVDSVNLGNKNIAYSPNLVAGNCLVYQPTNGFQIALLSKFVGDQYLNNIELEDAKLPNYFVNDLNVSYQIFPKSIFSSIVFTGLCNNIFSKKYSSNGYMYDIYPYYYPQAERNYLVGMTLKF
jgi:iron complex outermembrane receptor protein